MRCNCEVHERFKHDHEPAACERQAMVKCSWIGGVCLVCAPDLEDYLIPLSDFEGSYRMDEENSKFLLDLADSGALRDLRDGKLMLVAADLPGEPEDQERDLAEERFNADLLREE